jgi:hypothetical protein
MSIERIELKADPEVIAAWQSHFAERPEPEPDWLTSEELAELSGVALRTVQVKLTRGVRDGVYQLKKAQRLRNDGHVKIVSVYKLVENKRGKRGRG